MNKKQLILIKQFQFAVICIVIITLFAVCTENKATVPPSIELTEDINYIKVPSFNGNLLSVTIYKPDSAGPYPALAGVSGGDGMHAFQNLPVKPAALDKGILLVDFAPQGRGLSKGEDNHNGYSRTRRIMKPG